MNLSAFLAGLPGRYYAWGSVAPQPRRLPAFLPILDRVRAMTAPGTMELLSYAVSHLDPGECYMEAGTWHGATLIGALLHNPDAHGYAIDDQSMAGHDGGDVGPRERWHANVAAFGLSHRAAYIDGAVPGAYEAMRPAPPVGVFLYDAGKATADEAYEGIAGALPTLSRRALIVLDDANTSQIRLAAHRLCRTYPAQCAVVLDVPTPANCYPTFWDGVMALAWEGGAA